MFKQQQSLLHFNLRLLILSNKLLRPPSTLLNVLRVVSTLEIGQTVRTDFYGWAVCIVTNPYSMSDLNNIDLATDFYASSKYLIPDAIVLYNIYNKKELNRQFPYPSVHWFSSCRLISTGSAGGIVFRDTL